MRTKQKVINLFEDKNIYSIKYVISINTEDDLNQFWDFMTNNQNSSYDLTHAFITQFYNFSLSYIYDKNYEFFEIILEESEKNFYFTLWNKKVALMFKAFLRKTSLKSIYKDNQISIKIGKLKSQQKIEKIHIKNDKRENDLINYKEREKPQEVYTFIDSDDLEELFKLSDDMQESVHNLKKVGMQKSLFISLRSTFSMFCLTLRYYDKIAPMAKTITEFSNLINMNQDQFINLSSDELELINGFINNIDYWLHTLFVNGGADIYFMDNSIRADFDMIESMIFPKSNVCDIEELNDIFNF
ncbi:hypothetical protein N9A28_05510 [Sulfurimonas sp.]|nr:hypothetical protein [Sulfurimonas sp.]